MTFGRDDFLRVTKRTNAMKYPPDIDRECIALCDALNCLPGIMTFESCCGHGIHPHRIFFNADTIQDLRPIVTSTSSSGWAVECRYANGSDTIYFLLEGPRGPAEMHGGANDLASWITNRAT